MHYVVDRTKESTNTTGTGAFGLAGALPGFLPFSNKLTVNGDTTWYCAVNGNEWEIGLGTRASAGSLTRTTVLSSSNANALVNFSASPTVFGTVPGSSIGAGPAFSAYPTVTQALPGATVTKLNMGTVEYDTDGCYSAANSRFTPNRPGYYQINGTLGFSSSVSANSVVIIMKNGASFKSGSQIDAGAYGYVISALIFLNGTTDYVELAGFTNSPRTATAGAGNTWFQGAMVRPA